MDVVFKVKSNKKITLSQRWPRDAPNIWVPWKLYVRAKSADNCARIATLQSYHYSVVKLFSKCSNQCDQGTYYLNVTDEQTDGRYTVASPHGKTRETKCRRYRYYRYRRYLKTDIDHHYMYTSTTRKFSYRPKFNETVWTVKWFIEWRRTSSVRQRGYKIRRANYSHLSPKQLCSLVF